MGISARRILRGRHPSHRVGLALLAWIAVGSLVTPTLAGAQEGISFSGRVGFRAEFIANENFAENDATRDDDHRVRFRARVRFGGEFNPSSKVTLGFRLTTGSTDYPSSGWFSLSDDFRRDPIAFDRAYVNYQANENLQLRLGLNANPLYRNTELVWDGDVQPGGFSEVLKVGRWEVVAGQFMLREVRALRSTREESSFLLAHSARWAAADRDLSLGLFHYLFTNPNALATALERGELNSDFLTNRFHPDDPGAFFSDYNILGASVRYRRSRLTLVGELAVNTGAENDTSLGPGFGDKENLGVGALITYGALEKPWSANVTTGFFHVGADAVVAAYNSDDIQQTNVNTVPVWVRLRLPGGADLEWDTYFQSKVDEALASNGGIVHDENALKVRMRITIQARF